MTRSYSDSIALAAQNIVAASAVDITQPVSILPLAKQLMQETGCGIDAAKRHVARAVRLARGELTTSPAWGGRRTPAGGRPNKMSTTIHTVTPNNSIHLTAVARWPEIKVARWEGGMPPANCVVSTAAYSPDPAFSGRPAGATIYKGGATNKHELDTLTGIRQNFDDPEANPEWIWLAP